MSRILGLILVLVLVGVFSFVAYKKYNEAKLHPIADTPVADNNGGPPAAAGSEPAPTTEPNPAASNATTATAIAGSTAAPNTTTAGPHGFQQLDEAPNPNAAFHPTSGGSSSGQVAENSTSGQTAKPAQSAASENDANPFNDIASNAPPSNGSPAKHPQAEANRASSAVSKPVASDEPRNDQSEPLFNEGAGQQAPQSAGRPNGQTIAATPNATTPSPFPGQNGGSDSAKSQHAGSSARSIAVQLQPVQSAQNEQTAPTRQPASTQGVPAQGEPATNELLSESPKPSDVAKSEHPATAHDAEAASPKASAGGLLDQEEPLPTAAATPKSEPVPVASASVGTASAGTASTSPRTPTQTAQASTTTAIHASPAPTKTTDGDDLFAAKSADATANSSPAPIPQSRPSAAIAGNGGVEATLNEAGDFYVVQPQDTFWTISRKKYGTARYFMALAQLNKAHVPDPTRMRPGVKVSTPPTEILETQFAQYLPKGSAVEVTSGERQAAKPAPTGFFVNSDGKPMYRTGEKDTLSDIAARHLGRASRWIQVFEMNRDKLSSPNQVKVGTELVLPGDASNVAVTNDNEDRR
ncbi:MAG TPA: LysM peptidoglycan-binding domain-containing protein [Planctomycetaceae bacterium]|nr:LysM peptidoglycan-binding domain-containing protein [Planctomycetaceae bacterium]